YVGVRPRVDYRLKKNWLESYPDVRIIGIEEQKSAGLDVNNIRMYNDSEIDYWLVIS
ncbi:13907_t:CDS:1, partial [Acaulospora morrowiae]